MNSGIEVRVLNENDAASLWKIRLEALQQEPDAFGDTAEEHQAITIESLAARMRPTDSRFGLGAFVSGQLVGTVRFERPERAKNRHRSSIHAVYVSDAYRGKGVARTMLAEVIRMARAQAGVEQIELTVGVGQTAAKRLYESFGFKCYGRHEHALKIGEQYIDQDLMVLRLS